MDRATLEEWYEHPEQWLKIGSVCAKAGGHLVMRGEDDYGACGSHHSADIFIVPKRGRYHPDYSAFEEQLGEERNTLRGLQWDD